MKVEGSAVADFVRVSVPGGWWGVAAFLAVCLLAMCPADDVADYARQRECERIEEYCLRWPDECDTAEYARCISEGR